MTKFLLRFFRWFCHPSLRNSIEGDLIEIYNDRLTRHSKAVTDLLLMIDVLLLFRPSIIRPIKKHQSTYMFGSYLTIGWRTLLRNKGYSAINIGGLAAGMAVTILISMWIYDELSFNKSFEKYNRIGEVAYHNGDGTNFSNPIPLAWELRENYSQDFERVALFTWPQEIAIASGQNKFKSSGTFVESAFTEIFSFNMIYGIRSALTEPNTILISGSLSKKLFGDIDPIGQTLRLKDLIDVRVGGVYRDFSPNTEFNGIDLFGSWEIALSWVTWMRESQDRWDNNSHKIYVQLKEGVTFEEISAKIKDIKKRHIGPEQLKYNPEAFVHPMSKWRLYSEFQNRKIITSDKLEMVWLYGIIDCFVLILACINFMNLNTARSEKRAKEVGIRKTMGSLRGQLITQFLSESFITVTVAAVFAIGLVLLALPYFNEIAGKQISFPWNAPAFWLAVLCFIFIAGLIAGSYPALYLSSFRPIKGLKLQGNSRPRQILVVIQFTVSMILIVGTIVIYQQIHFAKERPVGYTRQGLIKVFMDTGDLFAHYDVIRNELIQTGAAADMAKSSGPVTEVWTNTYSMAWEGKPEGMESRVSINWITPTYGNTVGWKVIEGRDFSEEMASDSLAVVINRSAAKYMGFKDPIGKEVDNHFHVIGVIEDLTIGSPYEPVRPTVYFNLDENMYVINIRLNPSMPAQASIEAIGTIFQKHDPSEPFEFSFVDEDYNKKFTSEVRVGKLATVFAVLAILISLLGLFGLSSFVAERRTKEIGIRKVVGASIFSLWGMLTKNFLALVAVSCAFAFPVAYYALSNWLTRFEYRIVISMWIFPVVILGALFVTLATVSYQALRAAMLNPVESLKSE